MPEQRFVETHGIRLHVLQDGPEDGRLVILLHGFPEFSYGWRKQLPCLAAAGYRVWAPDQRGYNLSDKPDGIAAYALDELVADVIGLMDAAGCDRAFLVGHDWGAAVAWWLAQTHPERVARLGNWRLATGALTTGTRPGAFTEADLDAYREAWSRRGAMRSMLHWYRAIVRQPPAMPAEPRITVPTLMLWGVNDLALTRELAQPSIDLCDDGRLVFFEDASHWVQHEEPARVNELLGAFLAAEAPPPAA